MRQIVLLPQTFLPLKCVRLGRLVLNVQDPQSDFLDPLPIATDDVIIKPQDQFRGQESSATANGLGGGLCHLLSVSRSKQKRITTRVTTERVTTYLLNNSGQWFKKAVQNENTRKWIETANRRGEDIYLVAGYHTVLDARVYEGGAHYDTTAGTVALPVAEALTATGIVVPFGEFVDPSVTATYKQQQAGQQSFTATGEQICAVQYRKVHFKWYTSGELHDRPLGSNKWKPYWTFRGQTDDVVEVVLQDNLELEDDKDVCVYDEEILLLDKNRSSKNSTSIDEVGGEQD